MLKPEKARAAAPPLYVPIRFFLPILLTSIRMPLLNCADFLLNCPFFR